MKKARMKSRENVPETGKVQTPKVIRGSSLAKGKRGKEVPGNLSKHEGDMNGIPENDVSEDEKVDSRAKFLEHFR